MNQAQNNAHMRKLIKEADDATCKECGSIYFESSFRVKRVSAIMSPSGQEIIMPVQVLRCQDCHAILNDLEDFTSPNKEKTEKNTTQETKTD